MPVGSTNIGRLVVNLIARTKQFQSGMKGAQARLHAFSAAAMRAGSILTIAAGGPLAASTAAAASFQYQLANVGTMLGEASDKWLPHFEQRLSDVAVQYGQSTQTLTEATYDWVSAQQPIPQAMEAAAAASKSAWAGFTETKTAMSAMITVSEAFGDQIEDMTDAADFLFSVVRRGRLTFEELAQNVGNVAPVADAAGVSMEEFGAALAMITRGMPNTRRATTSLRNLISSFLKTTEGAKEVARKYGIELSAAALRSKGLFNVLQDMSKLPREVITQIIPRRRALRGLWILLDKINRAGTDLEAMYERAGVSAEAFEKVQDTLAFQMARMWQAVVKAGRVIGMTLLPAVREAVEAVTEWINRNQRAIENLARVLKAVTALGAVLLATAAIGKTLAFIMSPAGAFGLIIVAALALLDSFDIVNTGFVDMVNNIRVGGHKIKTWLTQAWLEAFKAWETFSTALSNGWDRMITYMAKSWSAFRTNLIDGWDRLTHWITKQLLKIKFVGEPEKLRRALQSEQQLFLRRNRERYQKMHKEREKLARKFAKRQHERYQDLAKQLENLGDTQRDVWRAEEPAKEQENILDKAKKLRQSMQQQREEAMRMPTEPMQVQRPAAALRGTRKGYEAALPGYGGGELRVQRKTEKHAERTADNTETLPDIKHAIDNLANRFIPIGLGGEM